MNGQVSFLQGSASEKARVLMLMSAVFGSVVLRSQVLQETLLSGYARGLNGPLLEAAWATAVTLRADRITERMMIQ